MSQICHLLLPKWMNSNKVAYSCFQDSRQPLEYIVLFCCPGKKVPLRGDEIRRFQGTSALSRRKAGFQLPLAFFVVNLCIAQLYVLPQLIT